MGQWAAANEEAAKGWLTFSSRAPLPSDTVLRTRLNKISRIDNFRSSFVSSACSDREKVSMDGVDEIANACLAWRPRRPSDRILGRAWDLKNAYKQLDVRADHKK